MIFKSIGINIHGIRDFEFLIGLYQTTSFVSKKHIMLHESLRDRELSSLSLIILEMLHHSYELLAFTLISWLQPLPNLDDYLEKHSPTDVVKDGYGKLRSIMSRFFDIYHTQFIFNILNQAIYVKDHYRPHKHSEISVRI